MAKRQHSHDEASTPRQNAAASRLVCRTLALRVLHGPDRLQTLAWEKGRAVRVGRCSQSDFVLTDPLVSRSHFSIEPSPAGVILRDQGSENGVRVNGTPLREGFLEPGARIEIGNTILVFEVSEEEIDLRQTPSLGVHELVGNSAIMRQTIRRIEVFAPREAHVLIVGETGTGKELAAAAIHRLSGRAGSFVRFSGAAASAATFESELFGHEKGAYTGADRARVGAFREAAGGTLFLDEVHRVPVELQPRLLHALDFREVKPLGSDRWFRVPVRIVAATNQDLSGLVESGRFLFDLQQRLSVLVLPMPPLREHLGDLKDLIAHFSRSAGGAPLKLTGEAPGFMNRHSWPGNVRELQNVLERCRADCADGVLTAEVVRSALVAYGGKGVERTAPACGTLRDAEIQRIKGALEQSRGNQSKAARLLGISRSAFREKLVRYGLLRPSR